MAWTDERVELLKDQLTALRTELSSDISLEIAVQPPSAPQGVPDGTDPGDLVEPLPGSAPEINLTGPSY